MTIIYDIWSIWNDIYEIYMIIIYDNNDNYIEVDKFSSWSHFLEISSI